MYAVIRTGGKQYRVSNGQILDIEKIEGNPGEGYVIDEVMSLHDGKSLRIGTPLVKGATVNTEILTQKRGEKVIVFKKKRRQNYRRKQGHRQSLTTVRVIDVLGKATVSKPAARKEKAQSAPVSEQASASSSSQDKTATE